MLGVPGSCWGSLTCRRHRDELPAWGTPGVPAAGSPGGQLPSHPLLSLSADDVPPPPAPFAHRIVTLRSANVSSQFNLSSKEILGG